MIMAETCRVLMIFTRPFLTLLVFQNVYVKVCLKEVHDLVLNKVNIRNSSSLFLSDIYFTIQRNYTAVDITVDLYCF
jgi:hypothetical protein